jgi:hypothetical protein
MKIQVILEGGLGNQMFQYAMGRSMSLHYNAELSLYAPSIYGHATKREYQLNYFGIEKTDDFIQSADFIQEFSKTPEELYSLPKHDYIVKGYWQNEKYFAPNKEQIRTDFDLGVNQKEGRLLVQIRRTDYLNNKYHEYCDLSWYKRAIEKMEFDEIYFTSDDIEWCKENFDYINKPKTYIEGNEIEQFKGMYSSDRFVISNSSFGWWGAWWTNSQNVICPAIWTPGNSKYDPSLPNWQKM